MELKSLSHYPYSKNIDGEYRFVTDKGVEYIAYFNRVPIESCVVYNFVFAKSTVGRYGMDPRIRNTILGIISDFWDDYEEVILFVCDSSDGRSECRMRLFHYWYKILNNDNNVTKIDYSVEQIRAAILAKKDNCLLPLAQKEIQELFVLMQGD